MKRIDIIIPAYKAQNTIIRTLSSIAMQTIVSQCLVTIVNDADGVGYDSIVKLFKNIMDIRELTMSENGGPGVARQVGIEHSSNEFITFIDADDSYEGAYALENLLYEMDKIENKNRSMCGGNFIESVHNLADNNVFFVLRKNDMIWMFGKLYRRSFLEKYKISFNTTRSNEDNGFNTLLMLCAEKDEEPCFLDKVVYTWHYNPNSITRINDYNYTYNANIIGYSQNMTDAIFRSFQQKGSSEKVLRKIIEVMVMMYVLYVGTVEKDPRYSEQNYNACVKYYKDIYESIDGKLDENAVKQVSQTYLDKVAENLKGFIPEMTYKQFLIKVKEDSKKTIESQEKS